MSNSTAKRAIKKPAKPYRDFPLFAHGSRRWAKKIRGRHHYFGAWTDDPDGGAMAALAKYQEQAVDLHAGRVPRAKSDGLTLRELANKFLTSKRHQVGAGELSPVSFKDYHATCRRLIDFLGPDRLVSDLTADDFEPFRAELTKTLGPTSLGPVITRCRSVLKYAFDNGLIDRPVRYGSSFNKPSKAVLRRHRNGNGAKMFEASEIHKMFDVADVQLRAMILLGCNAALGNADIGRLPLAALDLDGGWLDLMRQKTGIPRRIPLWQETTQALREAIAARPDPRHKQHADRVFLCRTGLPWTDPRGGDDRLGRAFRALLRKLDLYRPGRGFYTFRHVVETVAGESCDQVAVDAIMGHARDDMASIYRERISNERLTAVVGYVRSWLFGKEETK